MITFVYT